MNTLFYKFLNFIKENKKLVSSIIVNFVFLCIFGFHTKNIVLFSSLLCGETIWYCHMFRKDSIEMDKEILRWIMVITSHITYVILANFAFTILQKNIPLNYWAIFGIGLVIPTIPSKF